MTSKAVDTLKKKRDQLNARIQKLEAAEKARERKRETRRKILVGAYFLDQAKQEGNLDTLYQTVLQSLKRESDKTLFTEIMDEEA